MAKEPKQQKAPRQPARKGGKGFSLILWAFMFVLVMMAFPQLIILLFIGMLPTVVAYIIDKTPKKYAAFSVGGMNLSGVFPALGELWTGNNTIPHAIEILTNIFDLIVMYAAASFGWLIYIAVPPVVNALLAVAAQHRIAQLRSRQRELIREWGQDIATRTQENDQPPEGAAAVPPANGNGNGAVNGTGNGAGNGTGNANGDGAENPDEAPVLTEITGP